MMMVLMALGAGSDPAPKRRRLKARRNVAQRRRAQRNESAGSGNESGSLSLSDLELTSDSDTDNQPARAAAAAPTSALPDDQWPVVWFSTTLSKKGSLDIPTGWFDRMVSFIDNRAEDGSAVGLERGRQKGNLHCQGLIGLKCDPSLTPSQRTAYWKDQVKRFIPIGRYRPHSDGILQMKELEDGQEYLPMLGYTMKDADKPHYRHHAKNIAPDVLREARLTYDAVATSYLTGLTKVTRANITLLVYGFMQTCCAPMTGLPFRRILLWMHQSGDYVPAPCWATPSSGRHCDPVYTNLFYELACNPKAASMGLIKAVYFYKQGTHFGPYDRRSLMDYRGKPKRKKDSTADWGFDNDADKVELETKGPEAAAALPVDYYNTLDDYANSGAYDYGTDDDECVDPWHGTNWDVASDMFARMRSSANLPPRPGPHAAPNGPASTTVDSPDHGDVARSTDFAVTARRNRATRIRANNLIEGQVSDASGTSEVAQTNVSTDAGFRCDHCTLVVSADNQPCEACGGAMFTRVGAVSLDDVSVYRALVEMADGGQIPTPRSQAEAIAMAPATTTLRGLTSARATCPGMASELINTIRDGREAMVVAAESRAIASQGRGMRRRTTRVPYTPPDV